MSNWKQVSGDMTWERHGVVLAKDDLDLSQVQLVRIEPWLEHDREAAVTHGLYLVDERTVDYEDLAEDSPEVRNALRSVGMEIEEFLGLPPVHKAEVLASHIGYDESHSVDRLADALPAPVHQIEFWGGAESEEKLASYDRELRRESLEANFDTRLTFGELPGREALEFALGSEGFAMELGRRDALAFEYAIALAGTTGDTGDADSFADTVRALVSAPSAEQLDPSTTDSRVEALIENWRCRYGDPSDDENGIAAAAQELASSLMSAIGFDWT
jgi:hypothetical protein